MGRRAKGIRDDFLEEGTSEFLRMSKNFDYFSGAQP